MPSQRAVALSLDEETHEIWKNLPVGERSERVRSALRDAEIVERRDMLIEALRRQIKNHRRIISDIRLLCSCKSIKAHLDRLHDEGILMRE
jgi:hypothetical protein